MATSIRDICRQTGLSVATVSLALRGKGRVAPETRVKVCAAAKALGYEPHPLFSRAFALARQPGDQRYRETLAFIMEWEIKVGPPHQEEIHAGAIEQALKMGYKLESFVVSGKIKDQRQVSKVLQARGIRGLIVIPRLVGPPPRLAGPLPRLRFDWQHFASVEIGRTLWHPRNLNRVESMGYSRILEALHLLKKVGYQRIGMAVEPTHNRQQNGVYYAAYLQSQLRIPAPRRIPILAASDPWDEKNFRRWIKQYQPDVLFIHGVFAQTILQWLKNMKLRVPKDISLFCGNVLHFQDLTGLKRDYHGLGQAAVEMVSLLLANDQFGLIGNPRCWQIDESWQTGKTLSRPITALLTEEGFLRQGSLPHSIGP